MAKKATSRRKRAGRARKKSAPKRARVGKIFTGDQVLHDLFREQAAAVLEHTDIGEEEKQSILLAMTCPCCGAGTMSFSVKMRPKRAGRFTAEES